MRLKFLLINKHNPNSNSINKYLYCQIFVFMNSFLAANI